MAAVGSVSTWPETALKMGKAAAAAAQLPIISETGHEVSKELCNYRTKLSSGWFGFMAKSENGWFSRSSNSQDMRRMLRGIPRAQQTSRLSCVSKASRF
jgi:hypothetical protein